MAILSVLSILPFSLLAHWTVALQVTANSPCASVCLDASIQDASNPQASNTSSSEISCLDVSFSTTEAGRKFESCVSCLQNSTSYSPDDGNDQEWFIYNIRYALGSCLFGFENATDPISTTCSTEESCGHLQSAIEDGSLMPSTETQYSYCSADRNAILGTSLPKCIECLRNGGSEVYLSNFLVALQAGCLQQPPAGTVIGLDGTVFSTVPVNITSPGDSPGAPSHKKHDGALSRDTIIGISVALGVLVIITLVTMAVFFWKRQAWKKTKRFASPLDSCFGANGITSPANGAYGDPYASPPVNVGPEFDISTLSAKERAVIAGRDINDISSQQISEPKILNEWQDAHAHLAAQPPIYTTASIPKHQAYIPTPPLYSQPSRDGFPMAQYPSAKSSTAYPPSGKSPDHPPSLASNTSPSCPLPHLAPVSPPTITVNTKTTKPSRTLSRNHGLGYTTLHSAVESERFKEAPVAISGPMIKHGGRFDFKLADKERREKEEEDKKDSKKADNWSPDSADSQEQWPGRY